MNRRIPRPSPAMIVAMLALFVALGGTVYAASAINGKAVKKNSLPGNRIKTKTVTGNKLKNDTLTGAQINESTLGKVPAAGTSDKAKLADKATTADKATLAERATSADTAVTATTALSASPPAYAHINVDGSVDVANSHNVGNVNVSHPEEGVYCLGGLSITPHVILAEVDSKDGPGVTEASVVTSNFFKCPPGSNAEIFTYDPTESPVEFRDYNGGFYIVIY